uniref:Uncharacterized protein n=1 Tax=Anguilla anguilla TaxID=7936 RepID=A0A0E9WZB3_ANGAN
MPTRTERTKGTLCKNGAVTFHVFASDLGKFCISHCSFKMHISYRGMSANKQTNKKSVCKVDHFER